jgi:hypothetical protein
MHFRSSEIVKSFDIWPLPIIQNPGCVDKNMTPLFLSLHLNLALNHYVPDSPFPVPASFYEFGVELDELPAIIFGGEVFEILTYFSAIGVIGTPIMLLVPGVGVQTCWSVAGYS